MKKKRSVASSKSLRTAILIALAVLATRGTRAADYAFITATDYATGSSAVIHLDGSYTTEIGVASVHSDAVARWYAGLVYVINREGADNIQVLDPADHWATIAQHSVGNGTNPVDIAFVSPHKAFVSRNDSNLLLIMDPLTGTHLGTVDLSFFADGDGLCEMDHLYLKGDMLFVSIQRVDRDNWWMPVGDSYLAVVDAAADSLVDLDPVEPGMQGIPLPAANPYGELEYDRWRNRLLVSCVGLWGVRDGGIAIVDPFAFEPDGLLLTETAAGGDIGDFEIFSPSKGYLIVDTPSFTTRLVPFDPSSGTVGTPLYSPPAWVLNDIEISPAGELFVADQTETAPGVWIRDAATGALILPSPRSTGLPPFSICFSEPSTTDARPTPSAQLGRPFPNPFNPLARIPFTLAAPSYVELAVYDARGALVRVLLSGVLAGGSHEALWDGLDGAGCTCTSGVYFARLRAGELVFTGKLVLLR